MKYPWLDEYCLAKPGTEKDYKLEWEVTRYMLKGKMYVMIGTEKSGRAIITVKLESPHGAAMRQQYPDIIPGYYMNKEHWNSVFVDGQVPDEELKHMLDESYRLVFSSLSKKARKEILDIIARRAACSAPEEPLIMDIGFDER